MQFRIENHKQEYLKLIKSNSNTQKREENLKILKTKNVFFTKIFSSTNIGLQFYKPIW